jgi:hypothetical protein
MDKHACLAVTAKDYPQAGNHEASAPFPLAKMSKIALKKIINKATISTESKESERKKNSN